MGKVPGRTENSRATALFTSIVRALAGNVTRGRGNTEEIIISIVAERRDRVEDDVDGDEIEKDLWDAVVVKTRPFAMAMINTSKATAFKQGIIWRVVVLKLELRGDRETLE